MTAGPRFNGILVSSFAIVAVLMAIIYGVYGLLTFTVAQRTHEIGIRIALLGAERTRILGLVLQEGAVLVFLGIALRPNRRIGTDPLLEVNPFRSQCHRSPHLPRGRRCNTDSCRADGNTLYPRAKLLRSIPMIALRHC